MSSLDSWSLPLHAEKAVLGRLLVYKALDLHRAQMEAADYGLLWEELRGKLCNSTARQLRFGRDDQPLEAYLKDLARELREELFFPDASAELVCAPLLDFIDELMEAAARTEHDLLVGAFKRAVELAAMEYIRHGLPVPQELIKGATIEFEFQENSPGQTLPIQMEAYTLLEDEGSSPSAIVHVILAPRLLDEQTAFALPYVLLHECLCHVLQGPWVWPRMQADANSRFAEGWMDVVAYRLHAAVDAIQGDTSITDLMCPLRRAAQMQAADTVHAARRAHHDADRAWSHRAIGSEAANLLLDLLGRLPESSDDPDTPFMQLSVSLNASSIDNTERDLFVSLIYQHLYLWSRSAPLVPLVRKYLTDHDTLGLVAHTTALVV